MYYYREDRQIEKKNLKKKHLNLLVWLRYIDIFWTHGEDEFYKLLESLNSFPSNIKFKLECSK